MRRSVAKGIAISLFILLSLGIGGTAQNGATPKKSKKFDPRLQHALERVKKGEPLPAECRSLLPGKADWVDLTITCAGGDLPNLPGVVYRSKNGNLATVSARLDALQQLADHPNVTYVQAPHVLEKLSDTAGSAAVVRISELQTGEPEEEYQIAAAGVVAGDVYTVRVHAMDNLGGTLNPFVEVSGTAISPSPITDDDSGPDKDAVLTFTITTGGGTLVIKAKPSPADSTPTTGWYALVIERRQPWVLPGDVTEVGVDNSDATKALALTRVGTNVRQARTLAGGPFTGNGVIIGIIDSGIDISHADFIDDVTGQSRIRFLWDQTISGNPPDVGFDGSPSNDYGAEFDNATINANLGNANFASKDTDGHGSLVAGIAGGDGSSTDGNEPPARYAGVAYRSGATPGAEFIVVKSDLSTTRVIDALNYIFRRAILLDRPCVVNMSIGGQVGPHDGTGPIAQVIDQLVGCGRTVVVACGNSGTGGTGTSSVHATGTIAAGELKSAFFNISPGGTILDIWIDASPGTVSVSCIVTGPTGGTVTAADGATATGSLNMLVGSTTVPVAVTIANQTDAPTNGDAHIQVTLSPGSGFSSGTVTGWTVSLQRAPSDPAGSPAFDMYATRAVFTSSLPTPPDAGTLTDEATAVKAIAVGATSSKFTWRVDNPNGGFAEDDAGQSTFGRLASFSSRGPARGGLPGDKPDVVAPGARVTGPLSKDVPLSATQETPALAGTNSTVNEDARHQTRSGTSFAAPVVTGIVALMLQKNPQLGSTADGAGVRTRLRSTAFAETVDGGVPNNNVGAGRVDAETALTGVGAPAALPAPVAPSSPMQLESDGATLIPLGGTVTSSRTVVFRATPTDGENRFVRLEVEIKPAGTAFDGTGTTLGPISLPGIPSSVAVSNLPQLTGLHWRVRTVALTPGAGPDQTSPWVAFGTDPDDPNEVDFLIRLPARRTDGGDCSLTVLPPSSSGAWPWLAALVLAALAFRKFRRAAAAVAVLLACGLSAFAQEDRLPPLTPEPTELDLDLGLRGKVSLWGGSWSFDALTEDVGEVESEANGLLTTSAGVSLYFNNRYSVSFDFDTTALRNDIRATVGGFSIGMLAHEQDNWDVWVYLGGLFADVFLDTNNGRVEFQNGFGLRAGVEVLRWYSDTIRAGAFVEVRYLKWDYDGGIVSGDDELGGFGALVGILLEFVTLQEPRP